MIDEKLLDILIELKDLKFIAAEKHLSSVVEAIGCIEEDLWDGWNKMQTMIFDTFYNSYKK